MTYLILILIPPDGVITKYQCRPEEMADVINALITLPERGMMEHGIHGIAGGNCFCDDLPMSQYIPGMAGIVIVDNDGEGFTDDEAESIVVRLQSTRMTAEEAETHRPPDIENLIIDNTAHIYVKGTSTPQGMKSVTGFLNQIREIIDDAPGKSMEVHYVERDFKVPHA